MVVAIPGIDAPRLKLAAVRAARDLAEGVLPGQPYLEVIGGLGREAHVAGAQQHDPIMQAEPFQDFLGAPGHAFVFVRRLFGRGDGNQFHFGELMHPDHAARVLARRAGLGAEARRVGGEAQR